LCWQCTGTLAASEEATALAAVRGATIETFRGCPLGVKFVRGGDAIDVRVFDAHAGEDGFGRAVGLDSK
jgi:hypothetical protein